MNNGPEKSKEQLANAENERIAQAERLRQEQLAKQEAERRAQAAEQRATQAAERRAEEAELRAQNAERREREADRLARAALLRGKLAEAEDRDARERENQELRVRLAREAEERVFLSKKAIENFKTVFPGAGDPFRNRIFEDSWDVLELFSIRYKANQLNKNTIRKVGKAMAYAAPEGETGNAGLYPDGWFNYIPAYAPVVVDHAPNYRFNHDPNMPTVREAWEKASEVFKSQK